MGLTWIDHDTIDKPVEELNANSAEAQDIQFKVETLKSVATSNVMSLRKESLMLKKVSMHEEKNYRMCSVLF